MKNGTWVSHTAPNFERHPTLRWLGRTGPGPWAFVLSPKPKWVDSCQVFGCRNKRNLPNPSCPRCSSTRWRVNNPERCAFANVRTSARKKKIPFLLTFEEFMAVAAPGGYVEGRGVGTGCLHIDRIDPLRGYEPGNIRCLDASENCRKGATDDKKARWMEARVRSGQPIQTRLSLTNEDEDLVNF